MKFLYVFFMILSLAVPMVAQGYEITVDVANYENDTLIVGFYYGDRQLVKDSLFATKKGKFKFAGDEKLEGGMYMLLTKPDNAIIQFLVPQDDQTFHIQFDAKDMGIAHITGSTDNKIFYDYLIYLQDLRLQSEALSKEIKAAEEAGKSADKAKKELELVNHKRLKKQTEVIEKYPGTVTYHLLRSNVEVEIPEFDAEGEERDILRYQYYKAHYFDNIDFNYQDIIRTPFFYERIETYLDKLTPRTPDSIIFAVDYLLDKMKDNPDARRFCLSSILNKYAKNKYIGMDGVYVHMVDKYYSKGEADWVDQENLDKMIENANNLRPILIGKVFPNITTYKENNEAVMVSEIQSEYTMVIFWAPDCGHCKKSMPDVVKFANEYKDKGLTVLSICTKAGEKTNTCWEFIDQKGMTDFINTGDKYQRFRQYVYVPSTPKLFILDKDKKILIKDVPAEELSNVMEEIIKDQEKKKAE